MTELTHHYELLAPHLGTVHSVLDIGCGMAGMDILLVQHHDTKVVHLVDGTGAGIKPKFGYNDHAIDPWNDVELGAMLVRESAPEGVTVSAHHVDGICPHIDPPPDLIMSLFSCGFHYPIDTYFDWFQRYGSARVLLDLRYHRKLTVDGMAIMRAAGYRVIAIVMEYHKGRRVLFEKETKP